jgi:hypothetical protein
VAVPAGCVAGLAGLLECRLGHRPAHGPGQRPEPVLQPAGCEVQALREGPGNVGVARPTGLLRIVGGTADESLVRIGGIGRGGVAGVAGRAADLPVGGRQELRIDEFALEGCPRRGQRTCSPLAFGGCGRQRLDQGLERGPAGMAGHARALRRCRG